MCSYDYWSQINKSVTQGTCFAPPHPPDHVLSCCGGGREMLLLRALIEFIYHTLFYGDRSRVEIAC